MKTKDRLSIGLWSPPVRCEEFSPEIRPLDGPSIGRVAPVHVRSGAHRWRVTNRLECTPEAVELQCALATAQSMARTAVIDTPMPNRAFADGLANSKLDGTLSPIGRAAGGDRVRPPAPFAAGRGPRHRRVSRRPCPRRRSASGDPPTSVPRGPGRWWVSRPYTLRPRDIRLWVRGTHPAGAVIRVGLASSAI